MAGRGGEISDCSAGLRTTPSVRGDLDCALAPLVRGDLDCVLAPSVRGHLESALAPSVRGHLESALAPPVRGQLESALAPSVRGHLESALAPSVPTHACQAPCGCKLCRAGAVVAGRSQAGRDGLLECRLVDVGSHSRVCPGSSGDCPRRELGRPEGESAAGGTGGRLQQQSGDHARMLVGTLAGMGRHLALLRRELVLKDEQMRRVQNDTKSIADELLLVKREKAALVGRVRQVGEELGRASRDRGDARGTELESAQWGGVDASCEGWVLDADLSATEWAWPWGLKTSAVFRGARRPYTYQLAATNYPSTGILTIDVRLLAGPSDALLEWPFRGAVTVTVAPRERRGPGSTQTRQCRIQRPTESQFGCHAQFHFMPHDLLAAAIDLQRGVRVSCQITPGAGGDDVIDII